MSESIANAFMLLFVVIDPIGVASLFSALTQGYSVKLARITALRGVAVAFFIIVAFALGGGSLLRYLGVSMPAFTIAGGVLLFLLAVDMVLVRQSGLRTTTPSEQQEAEHRADISVFPLAIPLIAGPGTLTTVLLLTGEHGWSRESAEIIGIAAAVLLLTLLALLMAQAIQRVLGKTGVNVIVRLFGILLAALAVQYVSNGVRQVLRTAAPEPSPQIAAARYTRDAAETKTPRARSLLPIHSDALNGGLWLRHHSIHVRDDYCLDMVTQMTVDIADKRL
ncbi:MAG: MarC family protein [Chromatiales bacterium]